MPFRWHGEGRHSWVPGGFRKAIKGVRIGGIFWFFGPGFWEDLNLSFEVNWSGIWAVFGVKIVDGFIVKNRALEQNSVIPLQG